VPSGHLPEVKDITSWIPRSQRFQVRLALDEPPPPIPLRVGMTGSVTIYVEEASILNRITRAVHQLVAWYYYL
jgi:hypothetical protein